MKAKGKEQNYHWPVLPEKYDRALHEAVRYIVRRYRPTAIIAAGSIIRGTPHPSSDLDMWVIHRKPFRQRVQKRFSDVPAEIFVNTPATVLEHMAEERKERRPVAAHMMAKGHVVLDHEPLLARLMAKARSNLRAGPPRMDKGETIRARYWAGSLFEDAMDMAGADPATSQLIMTKAVHKMLETAVKLSGRYQPRDKDLLAVVTEIDPGLGRVAAQFLTAASLKKRLSLARRIADRTVQCRGFIEWESEQVRVRVLPDLRKL